MAQRTIRTQYWFRSELVKVTHASHPNKAVANAVTHMQINEYGATVCQVDNTQTGMLHAEVKRNMNGNIYISYKRDPRDFVTASTLKHFKRWKRLQRSTR